MNGVVAKGFRQYVDWIIIEIPVVAGMTNKIPCRGRFETHPYEYIQSEYLLHSADSAALQTYLDAVQMRGRAGEDVLHYPFGEFTCTLVGLEDYRYL